MPYMGFEAVKRSAAGARDPGAVAASIGRKKYGKARFQKAAAAGKKMKGMKPKGSKITARDAAMALRERG